MTELTALEHAVESFENHENRIVGCSFEVCANTLSLSSIVFTASSEPFTDYSFHYRKASFSRTHSSRKTFPDLDSYKNVILQQPGPIHLRLKWAIFGGEGRPCGVSRGISHSLFPTATCNQVQVTFGSRLAHEKPPFSVSPLKLSAVNWWSG